MPTLGAIMPALPVRNLDAALAFYCEKLGFAVRHRMDGGGGAIIVRDEAELHLTQLNDESWRARPDLVERPIKSGAESFLPGTASLRIRVDGVKALYEECAANRILHPKGMLREQAWRETDFGVSDVDGNLLTFYERG